MQRPDTAGSRSESVRQANLSAILRSLHLDGPETRSDLVAMTGLTRSAVGALVGELTEMGFVYEQRSASGGSPGRPSPIVRVVSDHVTIAMEILVDSLAVAVVTLGGHVLDRRRVDRSRVEMPVEETVSDLVDLTSELLDGLPDGLPDTLVVHGVGVAIAAVVRRSDQRVIVAPNIGWHDVPLAELVRDALPIDVPVVIANDGDFGALAEVRRGVATGLRNVVYISGEVGVGAGVIADGRPIGGAAGFAGEVGHIPVNPADSPAGAVRRAAGRRRSARRHCCGASDAPSVAAAPSSTRFSHWRRPAIPACWRRWRPTGNGSASDWRASSMPSTPLSW